MSKVKTMPSPGLAQQSFAAKHSWFTVLRLNARSHFSMFEVPEAMAAAIEQFVS